MNRFIDRHSVLVEEQFGFQKKKDTSDAIAKAMEIISKSLDQKLKVLGIFIDMSKAFDCVDHNKLLLILEHYGIRGVASDWLSSYLTNRNQCVEVESFERDVKAYGKVKSLFKIVEFGVPQGSVLGPILFILYINELKKFVLNLSDKCYPILFADDANLILTGRSLDEVKELAVIIIKGITAFLRSLNLIVNLSKTGTMLFELKESDVNLEIAVDNQNIENLYCTKFLGVTVDKKLKWTAHLEELLGKARKGVYVMR